MKRNIKLILLLGSSLFCANEALAMLSFLKFHSGSSHSHSDAVEALPAAERYPDRNIILTSQVVYSINTKGIQRSEVFEAFEQLRRTYGNTNHTYTLVIDNRVGITGNPYTGEVTDFTKFV